ncbi:MAG: hypothetical protein ACFFBP_20900 [Promethearchaeota archaeon]
MIRGSSSSDEEFFSWHCRLSKLETSPREVWCSECINYGIDWFSLCCEHCCGIGLDPIPLSEIL